MRVFIGHDKRQPVAVQVLMHSIYARASGPVSITPLVLPQLPVKRTGLTEFTFSRYVVPHLCNYAGDAVFMDADMLCLGDIYELREICRPQQASVCVSKNKLRFEWPSLMYFKNENCMALTLDLVEKGAPQALEWATAGVGDLPPEWNHLVGYDTPRTDAKVVHFTQGIPCFKETSGSEYEKEWQQELAICNGTVSWTDIMGGSVHAKPVIERLAARAAAVEVA
jgi:hypothetical protein